MKTLYKILFILSLIIYQAGYSQCWFSELIKDFDKNPAEFKEFMKTEPDAMYAYEQLYKAGKSGLRQNTNALQAFSRTIKNAKLKELGFTDELLAKLEGAPNLSYEGVLNNLDKLGNNLVAKNIKVEDFNKLFAELYESGAKRDGANWIVNYIANNGDEFANKTIKFEEYINSELGGRFVDVTDISNQSKKIFYEFKSVAEVPPGHFSEQFMKDLTNANSLDQIKWMFNGAKNPPNFRTNMLNAIDNLPLTDNLAKKLLDNPNATKAILKNELKSKFDNIFKLSN